MHNANHTGNLVPYRHQISALQVAPYQTSLPLGGNGCQLSLSLSDAQTPQDIVRLTDIVNLMASSPSNETLANLIPGGRMSGHVFTNGYITYVIEGHWQRIETPTYYPDGSYAQWQTRPFFHSAGEWNIRRTAETGKGIFTLTEKIDRCDPHSAFVRIARECGVMLNSSDVPQMGIAPQDRFIETPHNYGSPYLPPHPLLGHAQGCRWFKTAFGQDSFAYCKWNVQSQLVGLFCCLVIDAKSRAPVWKYVCPPASAMIFNRYRLRQESNLPIRIYDSLEVAVQLQYSSEYVATWSDGIEHVADIDWQQLNEACLLIRL